MKNKADEVRRAAVLGSGTMGHGIAQVPANKPSVSQSP